MQTDTEHRILPKVRTVRTSAHGLSIIIHMHISSPESGQDHFSDNCFRDQCDGDDFCSDACWVRINLAELSREKKKLKHTENINSLEVECTFAISLKSNKTPTL